MSYQTSEQAVKTPRPKSSAVKTDIPHFTIMYDQTENAFKYTSRKSLPNEKIEQYRSDYFVARTLKDRYYQVILSPSFNASEHLPIKVYEDLFFGTAIAELNSKLSSSPFYKESFTRDITYPAKLVREAADKVLDCINNSEMFEAQSSLSADRIFEIFEKHGNSYILKSDLESLAELHHIASSLGEAGKFRIITGGPGTGKTHLAISQYCTADSNILVVSLSNLVGASFVKRLNAAYPIGRGTREFASYTKVNFKNSLTLSGYDVLIFEEASMLSMNEIGLMLKVIEANPGASIVVLGDVKQLPSFLGRGNLLSSLISEFGRYTEELRVQHRLPDAVVAETKFLSDNGNFPRLTNPAEAKGIIKDWVDTKKNFMLLAFSNKSVEKMNKYVVTILYPYLSRAETFYDMLYSLQIGDSLKCRATANLKLKSEGSELRGKYDFLNNESVLVTKFSKNECLCKSLDFDSPKRSLSLSDTASSFTLAYASTVHKAQGLEADYCFYQDDASVYLGNLNLSYVAFTRCKIEAVVCSVSNSKRNFLEYNNVFEHIAQPSQHNIEENSSETLR